LKILEPKPPGTLWATPGLLRDSFMCTFTEVCISKLCIIWRRVIHFPGFLHNKWAFNPREIFSVYCEHVCVCVCLFVNAGETKQPTRTADRMTSSGRYCVSEPSLIEQELPLGESAVPLLGPNSMQCIGTTEMPPAGLVANQPIKQS
jgi:hypothetical protein